MKKKVLVTSLLTIALCISVICGATLAIFTSNNTTKIDINSANVETESAVKFVGYKTLGQEWVTEVDEKNIEFDSKDPITASIDESGNISMNNLRAGDKARIELKVTNKSNISINYHMTLTADNAAVWTDLSVAVKEGGTEVTLGTDPANNLIKGTDWKNAGAVSGAESAELAAYEIEIGFDDAFAGGAVDNYSLTINTVAQQGNAPTTNFIGSADRVEDLVEQGYTTADNISAVKDLLNNGNNTKVVLTSDITFTYPNDNAEGHITTNSANGILDANGHTIYLDNVKQAPVYAYFYGNNEIRNAVFTTNNTRGIAVDKTSFYNCVFDYCNVYVTVKDDITIDSCTFNNKYLAFAYSEVDNINPKDYKVNATNNTFNINPEYIAGIQFSMYGDDGQIFANDDCAQYINVVNNTFTSLGESDNYDAIFICGNDIYDKKELIEQRVVYDETFNKALFAKNKFNGKANLLLNNSKVNSEDTDIRLALN